MLIGLSVVPRSPGAFFERRSEAGRALPNDAVTRLASLLNRRRPSRFMVTGRGRLGQVVLSEVAQPFEFERGSRTLVNNAEIGPVPRRGTALLCRAIAAHTKRPPSDGTVFRWRAVQEDRLLGVSWRVEKRGGDNRCEAPFGPMRQTASVPSFGYRGGRA